MAKTTATNTGLWPPSHFLAGEHTDAAFCFPPEFPYEFGVSSPSTETESSSDEEAEDFLASLTRRLSQSSLYEARKQQQQQQQLASSTAAKMMRVSAGSPQSTLSGIGSWSGRSSDGSPNGQSRVPSPQTTPFADPWEVLYAAAGEVARLKMNRCASHFDLHNTSLVRPASNKFSNPNLNQVHQQVNQNQQCASSSIWGRSQAKPNWVVQQQQHQLQMLRHENGKCNHPLSTPQTAWPAPQKPQTQRVQYGGSGSRVAVPGGSSAKKGCGGTGVFLPRHYDAPVEPRKKTGCAPVMQPHKVVHAMNLNIDDLNATSQQRLSNAFITDYEALLARRNALLMQQRLNMRREEIAANYEVRLPQEWTY
ncbi:uncharacterized protein LOC130724507 [Lotus japonicus]|uniref:uncharacterized protein LOC130724507 n=1 Tax=Lotus japonicus TaxID=34305 RepID=UPI00258322C0|nr:uncharacterized protein LOC130724507 [Lotus japonicus]